MSCAIPQGLIQSMGFGRLTARAPAVRLAAGEADRTQGCERMNALLDSVAALKCRVSHLMWAIAVAAVVCCALVEHWAFEDLVRKQIPAESGSGSDLDTLRTTAREAEFDRLLDSWIANGLPETMNAAHDPNEMIRRIDESAASRDESDFEQDYRTAPAPPGGPA